MPRNDASCRAAGDALTRSPELPSRTIRGRGASGNGTLGAATGAVIGGATSAERGAPAKSRRGLLIGTDPGKRRADGHFGADLDQHLLNLTGFENFDLDCTLLRLHDGDDIASLHMVSRLDRPFDQSARLHVGAERGHAEFRHGATC